MSLCRNSPNVGRVLRSLRETKRFVGRRVADVHGRREDVELAQQRLALCD